MLAYLNDGDRLEDWASPRNLARQYDFMSSSFVLWQDQGRPELSERFLAELNFYAAHLVSPYPGQFRHQVQYNVDINGTPHSPPPWGKVEQYLHEFMLNVNDRFQSGDVLDAAAYALYRLNWIHPFAQDNGRTSRAVCYFIVCQKLDRWLPGVPILPELIWATRTEYCELLMDADASVDGNGEAELDKMKAFLERLVLLQLQGVRAAQP